MAWQLNNVLFFVDWRTVPGAMLYPLLPVQDGSTLWSSLVLKRQLVGALFCLSSIGLHRTVADTYIHILRIQIHFIVIILFTVLCVIPCFRRSVSNNFALLGCHAASPTFRDNLSTPSLQGPSCALPDPWMWDRYVVPKRLFEITTIRRVTTQKGEWLSCVCVLWTDKSYVRWVPVVGLCTFGKEPSFFRSGKVLGHCVIVTCSKTTLVFGVNYVCSWIRGR